MEWKVKRRIRDRNDFPVHNRDIRPDKKRRSKSKAQNPCKNCDEIDGLHGGATNDVNQGGPVQGGIMSSRINKSGIPRIRMTRFCFIHINDDHDNREVAFEGCPLWCKGVLTTFCQVLSLRYEILQTLISVLDSVDFQSTGSYSCSRTYPPICKQLFDPPWPL